MNKGKDIIVRIIKDKVALEKIKDSFWKDIIIESCIDPNSIIKVDGEKIYLKDFDIVLGKEQAFFFRGYGYAKELIEQCNAFFYVEGDQLLINISNIILNLQTAEELFILKEIFIEGTYNVDTTDDLSIVLDIGMNVGIASLFFASKGNYKIFGYEPFPVTYNQALHNISLNPAISHSIISKNFGIGRSKDTLTLDYCEDFKGSMGIINTTDEPFDKSNNTHKQQIEIEDICDELKSIRNNYPKTNIIAKIDCEGSEYDIIRRLDEAKKISDINIYMIEWHRKGPKELIDILKNNGYVTLSIDSKNKYAGMIYAFKK